MWSLAWSTSLYICNSNHCTRSMHVSNRLPDGLDRNGSTDRRNNVSCRPFPFRKARGSTRHFWLAPYKRSCYPIIGPLYSRGRSHHDRHVGHNHIRENHHRLDRIRPLSCRQPHRMAIRDRRVLFKGGGATATRRGFWCP